MFEVKPKFNLVLCELHYSPIHGKTITSDRNIESHYLLIYRFDGATGIALDELEEYQEYNTDSENENQIIYIFDIQRLYKNEYANLIMSRLINHKTIRNYHNIISRPDYIKPEIGECIELATGEQVVIIKTVWLKIIQRKWKQVFAKRQQIEKYRTSPSSISHRQVTGRWPDYCNNLPGLKCMLSNL
jgi:hypothetical protein